MKYSSEEYYHHKFDDVDWFIENNIDVVVGDLLNVLYWIDVTSYEVCHDTFVNLDSIHYGKFV